MQNSSIFMQNAVLLIILHSITFPKKVSMILAFRVTRVVVMIESY